MIPRKTLKLSYTNVSRLKKINTVSTKVLKKNIGIRGFVETQIQSDTAQVTVDLLLDFVCHCTGDRGVQRVEKDINFAKGLFFSELSLKIRVN